MGGWHQPESVAGIAGIRTSYAKRYELLCLKLIREGLYDGAAFVLSNRRDGLTGGYREPNDEIGFRTFAASLVGRIAGAIALQK